MNCKEIIGMIIRLAKKREFNEVRLFYHSLIDAMKDVKYKPGWEKDIYPSNEYLFESIVNHELYIGIIDEKIISAMIINHEYNESYSKVNWNIKADKDEIMVIHALGVHPDYSGRGIGKELVLKAIEIAKQNHHKAIRLDVLKGNLPAEKLYTNNGFQYVDVIKMFYEDTGWTDFKLYEYEIKM